MNWLDLVILSIVCISAIISLMRGFVREALSLAAWVLSFWVAIHFTPKFAPLLAEHFVSASARNAVAFIMLFLLTLLAGMLVNSIAGQLVKRTGLSGTDRVFGILFGAGRGIVVVAILVLLGGMVNQNLPSQVWWQESQLMVHFQGIAVWMRDFLPADIAGTIVLD